MENPAVESVVRFGLDFERARVQVAAHNLSMANVALSAGERSPLWVAIARQGAEASEPVSFSIQNVAQQDLRLVHDPAHPLADRAGFVRFAKVDPAIEMATLVSATRAYEANIRAYNTLRNMTSKAFEIGK
ncbi:MAG: putative Flagellar basal-body rod protein flgC [Microvirga sp.]|jgi:flagellar basal-body rod protein FlgC|nr:putative Flagellar basal-body rod protein flgC [Microvirga sp.]